MTEDEFARDWYALISYIARATSNSIRNAIPAEDLTQVGMMGALALYRTRAGNVASDPKLVKLAAKREMYDHIRREARRVPIGHKIEDETAANTPSFEPNEEGARIRAIDLERFLRIAREDEREILAHTIAGETLAEMAARRGCHLTRVSQIRTQAIERIRTAIRRPAARAHTADDYAG